MSLYIFNFKKFFLVTIISFFFFILLFILGSELIIRNFAINEKCETLPQNPYSLSKLIGEQICSFYKRVENLDVIILRPFNIFGPDQNKLFLIRNTNLIYLY